LTLTIGGHVLRKPVAVLRFTSNIVAYRQRPQNLINVAKRASIVMSRLTFIKYTFFLLLANAQIVIAAPSNLYSWTDENGVKHFASKSKAPSYAAPAELPKINRGDVKLTESKLISCGNHGGINCQAGPDVDGSVICHDGFKDASPRYAISCAAPRLKITNISHHDYEGHFTVTVRNSHSVTALETTVIFKPDESKDDIILEGPAEIDPYGIGEFKYTPEDLGMIHGLELKEGKVSMASLFIKCANCP
jgi:hypothetical protein